METRTDAKASLIDLLRSDHERLRALFVGVEQEEDAGERGKAAREAIDLLYAHDRAERRYLYPSAIELSEEARRVVLSCKEAHHIANGLLMELQALPRGERWFAKFGKLAEGVRAHMDEEENELFPLLDEASLDLEELGAKAARCERRSRALAVVSGRPALVPMLAALLALIGVGFALAARRD